MFQKLWKLKRMNNELKKKNSRNIGKVLWNHNESFTKHRGWQHEKKKYYHQSSQRKIQCERLNKIIHILPNTYIDILYKSKVYSHYNRFFLHDSGVNRSERFVIFSHCYKKIYWKITSLPYWWCIQGWSS